MIDDRKTAIKNGLRQLSPENLRRLLAYDKEMVLDHYNYSNGKFCPLSVALGLNELCVKWTNEKMQSVILALGYKISNTRGIKGAFYTENRLADLKVACEEVLAEMEGSPCP